MIFKDTNQIQIKTKKRDSLSKISFVGVAGFELAAFPSNGTRQPFINPTNIIIQKLFKIKKGEFKNEFSFVGVAGFEPAAFPSKRDAITVHKTQRKLNIV